MANIIITTLIAGLTLKRYVQTKIKLLFFVIGFNFLWAIHNVFALLPLWISSSHQRWAFVLFTMFFSLSVSCYIIFLDGFEGEFSITKISFIAAMNISALTVSFIGLDNTFQIFGVIIVANDVYTIIWSPILSLILFSGIFFAGYWGIRDLNKSLQHAINDTQIQQIYSMRKGSIILFFVAGALAGIGVLLVALFRDNHALLVLGTWISNILAYIVIAYGFTSVSYSYSSSTQVAFLRPQRVEVLIVIAESGIPILQYEFVNDALKTDVGLISGAISAVTVLMNEAFGATSEIKKIQFGNREIMLNVQKQMAVLLITSRASFFLTQALNRFTELFMNRFPNELADFVGKTDPFKSAIPDLEKCFGLA